MPANTNSLYLKLSRYVQGGTTETANDRIEWWERKVLPNDPSDTMFFIDSTYEGNPQKIAAVFYGEPRLWWLICQYNSILDPIGEITSGAVILIPTKDRVQLMLTGKEGGFDSTRELIPTIPPVVV